MPKITMEEIEAAYEAAKKVYLKKQKRKDALDELENVHGTNRHTAADFIRNFKKMMDGLRYIRTMRPEATEYFFKSIRSDFGTDKLTNALDATQKHVDYYANLENGSNKNEIRALIEVYRTKVATEK